MLKQSFLDHANIIQIKADTVLPQGQQPAEALHDLINNIREALPPTQKHYLKPRSTEQLQEHLDKGNLAFAAMDTTGKLVACAMMSSLSDPKTAAFYGEQYGVENLTPGNWVIHTVGVHPDHNGQKLMARLLDTLKAHATANPDKFNTLLAKVAESNLGSSYQFMAAKFGIETTGLDPQGYTYKRFALNVADQLAPEAEIALNGEYEHPVRRLAVTYG